MRRAIGRVGGAAVRSWDLSLRWRTAVQEGGPPGCAFPNGPAGKRSSPRPTLLLPQPGVRIQPRGAPFAMPAAWDNRISARFMPKRYTSRELVRPAEEFGWRLVGVRGNHNFKHPEPVYGYHRTSAKGCTGGASGGYREENQAGDQVMRFLIMLAMPLAVRIRRFKSPLAWCWRPPIS